MKLVLSCSVLFVAACGSKKEAPPPPFTGQLTIDRIMASKDAVELLAPWDRALAQLEAKLGKPSKVDEAKGKFQWAAIEGERCAYVEVRRGDGKEFGKSGLVVASLQSPMTVDKDGPIMNRKDCLAIAGQPDPSDAPPPEDPDAAPPPADGVVAPADFEKLAMAGRSKWDGKQIKVTGEVTGTGGLLVNVAGVKCIQKTDADASLIGQTVTAEGTVRYTQGITGGGKTVHGVELADCTVTK